MADNRNVKRADELRACLFPAIEDGRAVLSEGCAARTLLMDMLPLPDLLALRSSCKESRTMVTECIVRVHGEFRICDAEVLSAVLSALPNAHVLHLTPSAEWRLADYIAAAQLSVVSLACNGAHVTDSILARFKGKLELLSLSDDHAVTDAGLRHVAGTPEVHLYAMGRITAAGISHLAGLRSLSLYLVSFDCAALAPLAPTLQELIVHVRNLDVSSCPPLPALTVLDVRVQKAVQLIRKAAAPLCVLKCSFEDMMGFRLSDVPTLTSVELHGCTGLTDETFDMPVPSVSVQKCGFVLNPTNVHLFKSCTHLNVTDIDHPNTVTDGDMHHLANLEEAPLTALEGITDVGMRELKKLRSVVVTRDSFSYAALLAMPCLQEVACKGWRDSVLDEKSIRQFQQLAYLALMKSSMARVHVACGYAQQHAAVMQAVFDAAVPPGHAGLHVQRTEECRHGYFGSVTFTFTRHGV